MAIRFFFSNTIAWIASHKIEACMIFIKVWAIQSVPECQPKFNLFENHEHICQNPLCAFIHHIYIHKAYFFHVTLNKPLNHSQMWKQANNIKEKIFKDQVHISKHVFTPIFSVRHVQHLTLEHNISNSHHTHTHTLIVLIYNLFFVIFIVMSSKITYFVQCIHRWRNWDMAR